METRAYRSKIGRLPFALRHELNERMRDNVPGSTLLPWLNATPEYASVKDEFDGADINATNLSDWRQTGYQDWLNDQKDTQRLRQLAELSQTMIVACGGDPAAVGSRLLSAKLLDILDKVDPEQLPDLAKSFQSLRSGEVDAGRLDVQRRQIEIKAGTLALDREKFEAAEARLAKAKDVITDVKLTDAERTQKIRSIFGL